jgi:hypothetical protein
MHAEDKYQPILGSKLLRLLTGDLERSDKSVDARAKDVLDLIPVSLDHGTLDAGF